MSAHVVWRSEASKLSHGVLSSDGLFAASAQLSPFTRFQIVHVTCYFISEFGFDARAIEHFSTEVSMLNFRDAIVSLLVNGMLFQKAVLDWDLKSRRNYADAPMVEMFESVVNSYSKTGMVPAKITTDIPGVFDAGPFTFDKNQGLGEATSMKPPQGVTLLHMPTTRIRACLAQTAVCTKSRFSSCSCTCNRVC